jgi:hypothetical protein
MKDDFVDSARQLSITSLKKVKKLIKSIFFRPLVL